MCCINERMRYSVCRSSIFAILVQSVTVRRAAFCTVCILWMELVLAACDHTGAAYSTTGSIISLCVLRNVFLFWPQLVAHSAFSTNLRFLPLVA